MMRFLCDVHISKKLSRRLEQLGYVSLHVNDILDSWFTQDGKIAEYCDQEDLTVITKDQDFRNSHLVKRTPKKLVKINLGNIANKDLIQTIENHMDLLLEVHRDSEFFMIEIFKNDVWVVSR